MRIIAAFLMFVCLNVQNAVLWQQKLGNGDGIVLKVLYDNMSTADSIITDFGLSCLIETGGESVLFDVGKDPEIFFANAKKMGVNLSRIDRDKVPVMIGDTYLTTGTIENGTYEQSLIVRMPEGPVVLTGCAHPGILEVVRRVKELTKQDVYLVMGGFHLISSNPARIKTIARELRTLTKKVGPCHCTGDKAKGILKEIFKEDYIEIKAGSKLTLGDGASHLRKARCDSWHKAMNFRGDCKCSYFCNVSIPKQCTEKSWGYNGGKI